ncbi:MAG: glutamine amidotransferase [Kiritimatiellia bacterium]|jgi:hypothetical protein|nr:glutamine amidotransferase [Kiritimatiellia bacterium]
MFFYPFLPSWLLLILLALAAGTLAVAARRRDPVLTPQRHKLLLGLRILSLLLLFLMLLNPGRVTEEPDRARSHLVFLLDQSGSMATRDLPGGRSRFECAVGFLTRNRFARLAEYPFAYYAFNSRATRHARPEDLAALAPEGATDLKAAAERIDREIGLDRIAAIILVSDGLDASGFRGSAIAPPVLSVQTGTDLSGFRDLAIEPFSCPEKLSEGEALHVGVPLLMRGLPENRNVAFRVRVNGQIVHAAEPLLTNGCAHTERIVIPPLKTGVHLICFEADALAGEITLLNNRREQTVEVVTARERIVAYFPLLNNSLRPLLREFTKREEDDFTAVYRVSENAFRLMGRTPDPAFREGLPATADAMRPVTCLILGAHNRDLLAPAEAMVLEQYVAQGGSLICLGGTDAFGALPTDSPLARLLPVATLENAYLTGAFEVKTDPAGRNGFTDEIETILAANLPGAGMRLNTLNPVRSVKAGARTELWAEEGNTRHPLIVWHAFGRGKVFAVLSNAFHLWGAPERRDGNFSRFWRQLIALARRVDDASDLLTVSLSPARPDPAGRVTLTVIARHPLGANVPLSVKTDVFQADRDTPVLSRTLTRRGAVFEEVLPGFAAGRYVVRTVSQDSQTVVRTRHNLLQVGGTPAESAELRSGRDRFRAISNERHLFRPEEADALEEQALERVRKNLIRRESRLSTDTPLPFAALVALLLTEWALRRRFNVF